MAVAVVPGPLMAVIAAGWNSLSSMAGRSCWRPGSNSTVPMAPVLPTLKMFTSPERMPDSATMRATSLVRSCIWPWLEVWSRISRWYIMPGFYPEPATRRNSLRGDYGGEKVRDGGFWRGVKKCRTFSRYFKIFRLCVLKLDTDIHDEYSSYVIMITSALSSPRQGGPLLRRPLWGEPLWGCHFRGSLLGGPLLGGPPLGAALLGVIFGWTNPGRHVKLRAIT